MTTIKREVRIDAPPEHVWAILADFGNTYIYNPLVPRSFSTSEAPNGVGATRHCDLAAANSTVEERIIAWDEGHSYTLEIYDGQRLPPFRRAEATLSVRPDGAGGAIAGVRFDYGLRFGPVGFLMDQLMVRAQFGKAFSRLLAGLKHYAETGEEVETRTPVNVTAVQALPA